MDSYSTLEQHELTKYLRYVPYEQPQFRNLNKVFRMLSEAVLHNKLVYVIGDYDVDGLMCMLIMKYGLQRAGLKNILLRKYTNRMHTLDPLAVQECIQKKCDLCIICDCGSRDIGLLKQLALYGIQVVLLDHHTTMTTYEEFEDMGEIAVVNTTLEGESYSLSAGGVCYCVMHYVCNMLGCDEGNISVYALISLYADCMDMRNTLNRSIYYVATRIERENLPPDVLMFMNPYQSLNCRFITFWLSPKINAMFRTENLDILNELFLSDSNTADVKAHYLAEMIKIYEINRELVKKVADLIKVHRIGNFILADLDSVSEYFNVEENKLWNYTGLVANILAERESLPALVYCHRDDHLKGSVRDIFGHNYLTVFKQLCYAEGHNSAFGVKIPFFDFDNFLTMFRRVAMKFSFTEVSNAPIIIEYPYVSPDNGLIEDIALINEFTGPGSPVILLKKQLVGAMKEVKTQYNYKYRWGDYWIQSSHAISFGRYMLLRPTKTLKTKLLVQ